MLCINAIVGKKEFMSHAQSTFISSTFWTERIGPTAALKTLDVMEKVNHGILLRDKEQKLKKDG